MLKVLREQQTRSLTFRSAKDAEVREAEYMGRNYLVVPVIMLCEGVVWPFASETRELVLASEIELGGVATWNGRPVVMDHPFDSRGRMVPANSPEILERFQIGLIFNARLESKKLHAEAWLDIERCEELNDDSRELLTNCRSGNMVEVSVGTYIDPEETSGEYDGVTYEIIWRNITPEHLAMLPAGTIGACSNDMGCGAPRTARAARVHLLSTDGKITLEENTVPAQPPTTIKEKLIVLAERVKQKFPGLRVMTSDFDDSNAALHGKLWQLLHASEPGFEGIWDIFQADNEVIYAVAPGGYENFELYRRKYTVSDGTEVSLSGARRKVEPVTEYKAAERQEVPDPEPVAEPRHTSGAAHPCGCQGGQSMKTMKERATALITSSRNKFAEGDRAALEALPEAVMAALEAADQPPAASPAPTPDPAPTPSTPSTPSAPAPTPTPSTPPAPTNLSAAEQEAAWLATAPQSVKDMINAQKARDAQEQAELVTACAAVQNVYTKEQLVAMPLATLRQTAELLKVSVAPVGQTDFSVRGLSTIRRAEDETVPAAPSMAERFAKKKTPATPAAQ